MAAHNQEEMSLYFNHLSSSGSDASKAAACRSLAGGNQVSSSGSGICGSFTGIFPYFVGVFNLWTGYVERKYHDVNDFFIEKLERFMGENLSKDDVSEAPRLDESSALKKIQEYKDEQQGLEAVREALLKPLRLYAVVFSLLVTVSFMTYMQPPGSFDDKGHMRRSSSGATICFTLFSSLSFYFSVSGLILCLGCSLTQGLYISLAPDKHEIAVDDKNCHDVLDFYRNAINMKRNEVAFVLLKVSGIVLVLVAAVDLCVGAYVAASYVVTGNDTPNRWVVVSLTCVGVPLFYIAVISFKVDALSYVEDDQAVQSFKRRCFGLIKFFIFFILGAIAVFLNPGFNVVKGSHSVVFHLSKMVLMKIRQRQYSIQNQLHHQIKDKNEDRSSGFRF